MNYKECVDYLYKIPRFTKKAPLGQTEILLSGLGVDLSMRAPRIIHVAGTNGKGSVCSYLDAILREDGGRTGLFTSPHLVRPEERIRIDGRMVSEDTFVRCFEKVYPVAKEMERDGAGHPAFFSFVLGMAMTAFLHPASTEEGSLSDLILETGMGGRLDNTNVFRHPAVTVITRIGLDHTAYLGNTREAIAQEKAGILKSGVPAVYPEDPAAAPVIEKRARELRCPLRKVDAQKAVILEKADGKIRFSLDDACWEIASYADYQVENAALAIRAAKELGCSERAISEGLKKARWPGRMQKIANGFYVDGAHNVDGVRALLHGMEDLAGTFTGRRTLLFGAVQDKDYGEMFRELADGFRPDRIILAGLKTPRGVPAEELARTAEAARPSGAELYTFPSVREALGFARGKKSPDDFLLCAGSLYLVGEVLENIGGGFDE